MGVPVVVLRCGLVRFVYECQLERECLNGVQAWAVLQITNNVVGSGFDCNGQIMTQTSVKT